MVEKLGLTEAKADWRLDMMRDSLIDADITATRT
jgi:hypothetical protein